MRKSYIVTAVFVFSLVLNLNFSFPAQAVNLLNNPGFEDIEDDNPLHWDFAGMSMYSDGCSSTDAHWGERSVSTYIYGSGYLGASWLQVINDVSPDDLIEVSCWAKLAPMCYGEAGARMFVDFLGENEQFIGYMTTNEISTQSGDCWSWTNLTTVGVVPQGTETIRVGLSTYAVYQGKAYFDDAHVSVVPEPGTLLLLSGGLISLLACSRRKK
ncbi:MAG: PEP-CTERM sorting domain-containing protein [Candidatus Omnitrophica bacterium]|nr:PEP-CTERM sorting domain-containing protein [Candidatus Omnitrophota bacterium]